MAIRLIKKLAKDLIGMERVGFLDYYRFPDQRASWGGPFNGQQGRKNIFDAIISEIPIRAIVETGTYLGTTTEYFATYALPVFSIEAMARNYGFAKARLWRTKNVQLILGDSREKLAELLNSALGKVKNQPLFFYLDAHWGNELPLAEEMAIIFSNCQEAVVMVDDFQVPDDPGYGYDDYALSGALTIDYIKPAMRKYRLAAYFPTRSSAKETGKRRGCVVLARQPFANRLEVCRVLRSATRETMFKGSLPV